MKKNKIDFRTAAYFPSGMIFVAVIFIFIGLGVAVFQNILVGTVMILGSAVILSTQYRLEIDFENRRYKEYVWILGLKNGRAEQFEKIEYLFIKQTRLSQNLNSLITTRSVSKDAFNGFLKLSDGETIHLFTKKNKAAIVNRLNKIAGLLKVSVVDYATDQ